MFLELGLAEVLEWQVCQLLQDGWLAALLHNGLVVRMVSCEVTNQHNYLNNSNAITQ